MGGSVSLHALYCLRKCVCVGALPAWIRCGPCGRMDMWCVSVVTVCAERSSSKRLACTREDAQDWEYLSSKINKQLNQVFHSVLLGEPLRNVRIQVPLENPQTSLSSRIDIQQWDLHSFVGSFISLLPFWCLGRVKQSLQSKWISQAGGNWMDIFSEMFATGGNIGPNRVEISSGVPLCLDLLRQGGSFMANNEYISPVMESGAKVFCVLYLCDIYLC